MAKMISVDIRNGESVLATLRRIPRQVRWTTAQAINATARDVQSETIRDLPAKLTLRGPWYRPGTRFGFNIRFAKESQLEGEIGSRADWLKLQEDGGTKTASGHRLTVPLKRYEGDKAAKIRRNEKPRVIRDRKGYFTTDAGIFRRPTTKDPRLRLVYAFTRSAKVKPVLEFEPNGQRIVDERFEVNFQTAFLKTMLTAQ